MKKKLIILAHFYLLATLTGCNNKNVTHLPAFNLMLTDSSTIINTGDIPRGEPTLLMYFSPDCEHCHHTTQEMLRKIDSLKEVHIYLLTPMPFDELRKFSKQYNLDKYRNITVGNDYQFAFYRAFKPSSIPYIVIYDKHKKLIRVHARGATVSAMIKEIHKES